VTARRSRNGPMIAIFCALEEEIRDIKKRVRMHRTSPFQGCRIWQGRYGRRESLLVLTGVGKEKAEKAAAWVLSRYPVEVVISTGFAGALNGRTEAGDIIVYTRLQSVEGQVNGDADLVLQASNCPTGSRAQLIGGVGVSIGDVCATAESKHRLGREFGADSVDMESYWIGRMAAGKGIPFLGVRVIFDAVRDDLTCMGQVTSGGKVVLSKVMKYVVFHSGRLKDLAHLYRNYRKAAQSLARFLDQLMVKI